MNLHDQLGVLESSLTVLLQAAPASAPASASATATADATAPAPTDTPAPVEPPPLTDAPVQDGPLTLVVSRPDRDAIEMSIGGNSDLR